MLDAKEHARILEDMDRVCQMAGVQSSYLHQSMTEYCGPSEVDWVRKFHQYRDAGLPGMVLDGVPHPTQRCQAIAAVLLRNYLDARVIPVNTLIEASKDDQIPHPTILIVPNLFVLATGKQPAWRVQVLYDLLLERATKNKPSVVYVEDLKSLAAVYGAPFHDFLTSFKIVKE